MVNHFAITLVIFSQLVRFCTSNIVTIIALLAYGAPYHNVIRDGDSLYIKKTVLLPWLLDDYMSWPRTIAHGKMFFAMLPKTKTILLQYKLINK